jgi:thioesterase domain-containing protein
LYDSRVNSLTQTDREATGINAGGFVVMGIWPLALHRRPDAERLVWSDKWSKRDKADAEAKAREASEREEEQRRQLENNRIREDGEKQLAQVSAAAADAESVNKRLQLAIERTKQQLARSETGRLSAIASERQTRADTAVLLAELYRKSDERAGQLAQYADRARIRGLTCEKAYDSIAAGRK